MRVFSSAKLYDLIFKHVVLGFVILISIGSFGRCSPSGKEIEELEEPLFFDKVVEGLKKLKEEWISPPDKGTINFLLFHPFKSKDNQWEAIATGNSSKINTKNLQAGKPFKIAIHGFLSSCKTSNDSDFPETIFQAYASQKKTKNYNFICVDWGILANPGKITQIASLFHYPKAVNSTLCVGDATERFIQRLISQGVLKNKDIIDVHIIGHSLGAHIGGVAGHEFIEQSKNKKKIAKISGLDPAGPAFYGKGESDKCKLGKSDAAFVDVVHTNMGQLGTKELLGHVNFILNGGVHQPFCKKENVLEEIAEKVSGVCSHASSNSIFAKSIKETITACKCKDWQDFKKANETCKTSETAELGDKVSLKARGTYCLSMKSL